VVEFSVDSIQFKKYEANSAEMWFIIVFFLQVYLIYLMYKWIFLCDRLHSTKEKCLYIISDMNPLYLVPNHQTVFVLAVNTLMTRGLSGECLSCLRLVSV